RPHSLATTRQYRVSSGHFHESIVEPNRSPLTTRLVAGHGNGVNLAPEATVTHHRGAIADARHEVAMLGYPGILLGVEVDTLAAFVERCDVERGGNPAVPEGRVDRHLRGID